MTTGSSDSLLTPAQVAKALNVTDRTIQRLAETDLLPHVWVGWSLRFEPAKIRAWVEAGGMKTASEEKPKRAR